MLKRGKRRRFQVASVTVMASSYDFTIRVPFGRFSMCRKSYGFSGHISSTFLGYYHSLVCGEKVHSRSFKQGKYFSTSLRCY